MNMRGDEGDADEIMREGMECVQNEQMITMRRGDSENDDVKCDVTK